MLFKSFGFDCQHAPLHIGTDPLLQQMLAARPIAVHNGFPDVLPTLRWADGVPLYLMGGLAALQLGPDAVNLAGGLRGAVRISAELKAQIAGGGGKLEGSDESTTREVAAGTAAANPDGPRHQRRRSRGPCIVT